jgi:hypothetical protein
MVYPRGGQEEGFMETTNIYLIIVDLLRVRQGIDLLLQFLLGPLHSFRAHALCLEALA